MNEYKCYTNKGYWKFYADDSKDAMRMALFLCWRDGEEFDHIEGGTFGHTYTLRICKIENNDLQTL